MTKKSSDYKHVQKKEPPKILTDLKEATTSVAEQTKATVKKAAEACKTKACDNTFLKTLRSYLITLVLAIIFFKLIIIPVYIPTESMDPTIKAHTLGFAFRLPFLIGTGEINRGDIVIFEDDTGRNICKRVIGVGKDEISITGNNLYLNCTLVNEPYIKTPNSTTSAVENFDVPEDTVFLLGDNRENSKDSRAWENPYVNTQDIKAKWWFGLHI